MSTSIIKPDLSLRNEEWYQSLVTEVKAIVIERSLNSRLEIIQGKWEIGQRVNDENDNLERNKVYGKKIVENIAKDIGISSSDLYFCTKFHKEFKADTFEDVLAKLPDGKDLSWYKITQKYLGKRDEKKGLPRTTYKIDEIVEALKKFLNGVGYTNELEVEEKISEYKSILVKLRK